MCVCVTLCVYTVSLQGKSFLFWRECNKVGFSPSQGGGRGKGVNVRIETPHPGMGPGIVHSIASQTQPQMQPTTYAS